MAKSKEMGTMAEEMAAMPTLNGLLVAIAVGAV